MIVYYRLGTFGWYVGNDRRYYPLAWEGNYPNECCWLVPGTGEPTYYR